MRWNSGKLLKSKEGHERIVRKFLLFPRCFINSPKWRWLEYANIVEQVIKCSDENSWHWCEMRFDDDPKE